MLSNKTRLLISAPAGVFLFLFISFANKGFALDRHFSSYYVPVLLGLLIGLVFGLLINMIYKQNQQVKDGFMAIIAVLATTLEERDQYTMGHSYRVTSLALQLGTRLQLKQKQMQVLHLSELLHDIGKIGVPDNILLKTSKLSKDEFFAIKEHPQKAAKILQSINKPDLADVIATVKHHHEWYDGRGYPDALKGEKIPYYAKIIALADSYDAMTSDRPYRKGMDLEQALQEINAGSETQFDPQLAENFIQMLRGPQGKHLCEFWEECPVFALMGEADIARAYEMQYCRANYKACARYKLKNHRGEVPHNILPDGRYKNS